MSNWERNQTVLWSIQGPRDLVLKTSAQKELIRMYESFRTTFSLIGKMRWHRACLDILVKVQVNQEF